jgi:hypothetical protein
LAFEEVDVEGADESDLERDDSEVGGAGEVPGPSGGVMPSCFSSSAKAAATSFSDWEKNLAVSDRLAPLVKPVGVTPFI